MPWCKSPPFVLFFSSFFFASFSSKAWHLSFLHINLGFFFFSLSCLLGSWRYRLSLLCFALRSEAPFPPEMSRRLSVFEWW
ncbi:hypothetical protein GGR50DRAFT_645362 [Xylaria sp. CBS 124048]|nr:hypothetical protein GGR50DRAFT_645362 [Xylaria sp. CBS 124048]